MPKTKSHAKLKSRHADMFPAGPVRKKAQRHMESSYTARRPDSRTVFGDNETVRKTTGKTGTKKYVRK